jgi:seryl-tRNA synthetase
VCHTLKGSSLALPGIVVELPENGQMEEGIRLPKVLVGNFWKAMID